MNGIQLARIRLISKYTEGIMHVECQSLSLNPATLSDAELWGTVLEIEPAQLHHLVEWFHYTWIENVHEYPGLFQQFNLKPHQESVLLAILELFRRWMNQRTRQYIIDSPESVHRYVSDIIYARQEILRGLYLNVKNIVLQDNIISIGTINESLAHPREVFAPLFEIRASRLVLVHNHPSGDPHPSSHDLEFTSRIVQIAHLFHIELLDHVIVSNEKYHSLRRSHPHLWTSR